MKLFLLFFLLSSFHTGLKAQENTDIYQRAIALIKSEKDVSSNLDFATGQKTVSFKNQAYAFWLKGEISRFENQQFDTFYGDFLYKPIKIKAFKKAGDKRKSKHHLFVTETVDKLFVIELLSRKREQKPNYPTFYQGESTSYLFEKTDTGVRLITKLKLQNN